ncbi:MAG: AI-2E family transporter [Bacteroidales bacterium]
MNTTTRYIIIGITILFIGFLLWYFSNIVAYIIAAAVLNLIGSPFMDLLGKIKVRKITIPRSIRALLTLVLLWGLFIGFFRIFIPVIANEANELSNVDVNTIVERLENPIARIESIYMEYNLGGEENQDLEDYVSDKLSGVLNFSFVTNLFGSLAGLLGNVFVAIFSISFITFFLLKEENLLTEALVVLVPEKHEKNLRHALKSVKRLLSRYFIGIILQLTGILTLVTLGMTIVGLGFKKSLLIGLAAAILNVVPYLGPIIGTTLGILLGIAFNINMEMASMLPLIGYMLLVFLSVQAIDNVIFQPVIFSNSVNAHPLEIFLVILMAGSIGGVAGMILAIPAYTIIRVFAKEFFNNFRVVKKLTKKI